MCRRSLQGVGKTCLRLKMSNLQTFADLSESDCSRSEPDGDCLKTGCLPRSYPCNRRVVESSRLEVEGVARLIFGQRVGHCK